jgi:hypothetical protein
MNLQPAFEATEQTEREMETRRGWSIDELRNKLGLSGVERTPVKPPASDEQARPRIVRRQVEALAG